MCKRGHEVPYNRFGQCPKCVSIVSSRVRSENLDEYRKKKTDSQLRRFYGIASIEERDALLAGQGGACAACGRTDCTWGKGWLNVWHVDHKHGEVGTHRGILCARCNVIVGILETASEHIQKCRDYLTRW